MNGFVFESHCHINDEMDVLIGACIMCRSMFNSYSASVLYQPGLSPTQRLTRVHEAVDMFASELKILYSNTGNRWTFSTINNLGKLCTLGLSVFKFIKLFHGHFHL